jgi:hypothetical protein
MLESILGQQAADFLVRNFNGEWAVVKGAPVLVGFIALVIAIVSYRIAKQRYEDLISKKDAINSSKDATIENKDAAIELLTERLKLQDKKVADFLNKTENATPSEVKKELGDLREELKNIRERTRESADSRHLSDFAGPVLRYDNRRNQLYLLVANQGPQSEFYGVFDIVGAVQTDRQTRLFCNWSHTSAIRTKIARGEACEIFLAELKWDNLKMSTARWEIYTATEDGPRTIAAIYSSMASPQIHRAEDIVLRGQIFADPDLPHGPMSFRVVLKAFGAAIGDEKETAA